MVSRLDQYIKWPDKNDALSVLLKPAGSRCNIDCLYCYDKRRELADGGYLSVARLEKFLKLAAGHPLECYITRRRATGYSRLATETICGRA